jgi:hypothetical protein
MDHPEPDPERRTQEPPGEPDLPPLGAGLDFTDPNSPLAPFYLRASHLVALLLLLLVFLVYNSFQVWHTDIWGHMKFGQWMAAHHELPTHEPFSPFADAQAPYINFQWLSQWGFYQVYRLGSALAGGDSLQQLAGGAEMLSLAHALLATLCYGLLLGACWRRSGSLPLACLGMVVFLLLAPTLFLTLRPQVVGEVFFAALMLVLSRPELSRRDLVKVPLLLVLWANFHGSYPVGLIVLGACLTGRALEAARYEGKWNLRRAWEDQRARLLFGALALSVVAIGVLNPHGPALYLHTLRFGRHPNLPEFTEWKPLDFMAPSGVHWVFLAGVVVVLVSQLASPRWLRPADLLLLVGFGGWACWQGRMLVWWLMLLPWVVTPLWAGTGERLSWSWLHFKSVPSFRKTLLGLMLVVLVLLWSGPVRWAINRQPRALRWVVTPGTPYAVAAELQAAPGEGGRALPALAEVLRARYPEGRFTGTVFSSETEGDYLLWALAPGVPVFVYTHLHLFTRQHWQECKTVLAGDPGWREVLDRHHANLIVVEAESHARLAELLREDPDWEVVLDETGGTTKKDPRSRLFVAVRKTPL